MVAVDGVFEAFGSESSLGGCLSGGGGAGIIGVCTSAGVTGVFGPGSSMPFGRTRPLSSSLSGSLVAGGGRRDWSVSRGEVGGIPSSHDTLFFSRLCVSEGFGGVEKAGEEERFID